MKDLNKEILSDPLVSKVISVRGIEVYLVGGYLRDIIRGLRAKDIDFVVRGDLKGLTSMIASEMGGSVVKFEKGELTRVIVDDSTIDFSELKGRLEDDLYRRDFTMNAIAWSPERGIVDPLDGLSDIKKARIRAISERNLIDDPLRLLRAYRFSAEMGWRIDLKTRYFVKKLKENIRLSAPERITSELFRLLNSENYIRALRVAFTDGLLTEILSIDKDRLADNLKALSRLNSFLNKIHDSQKTYFNETFSQGLTYLGLLRVEQLLYRSDMERNALRFSRHISKRIKMISGLLDIIANRPNITKGEAFDLLTAAGSGVMDIALLSRRGRFVREAERFLMIRPLLRAEEIIDITGIRTGPELGTIINEMRRGQFLGRIKDEEDARLLLQGIKKGLLKGHP
ncbi:MAG: CCA tRNA nucleotidyltransferase [Thermodesulfovibrionales bacterium]